MVVSWIFQIRFSVFCTHLPALRKRAGNILDAQILAQVLEVAEFLLAVTEVKFDFRPKEVDKVVALYFTSAPAFVASETFEFGPEGSGRFWDEVAVAVPYRIAFCLLVLIVLLAGCVRVRVCIHALAGFADVNTTNKRVERLDGV
jgi:hypothetical protein